MGDNLAFDRVRQAWQFLIRGPASGAENTCSGYRCTPQHMAALFSPSPPPLPPALSLSPSLFTWLLTHIPALCLTHFSFVLIFQHSSFCMHGVTQLLANVKGIIFPKTGSVMKQLLMNSICIFVLIFLFWLRTGQTYTTSSHVLIVAISLIVENLKQSAIITLWRSVIQ